MKLKSCPVCGKREPEVHFDGRQRMCLPCRKEHDVLRLPTTVLRDIAEVNEVRIKLGLRIMTVIVRACLRCDRRFETATDRLCPDCHVKNKDIYIK
jgi:NMD protein affecting ribosome stability and mRNA decay